MKFDDLLTHLGEFGLYQKRVYFLLCLTCITHGMRMVVLVFLLITPKHRCAIPGLVNDTYEITSLDHQVLYNMSIPPGDSCKVYKPGNWSYDSMNRPIDPTTIKCDNWVYDTSIFSQTVASKFNLVCDNAMKRSHATMVFYGGFLIGVFVLGAVSDLIGRKLCLYLSISMLLVLGTALSFATDYIMFVILNFFVGASTTGIFSSAFVIGIEIVGPSKRTYTGIIIEFFFSFGVVALSGLAYLIRDWKYLELAITLPMALFYLMWCYIPESPRWQVQKGRYDKARKTVEKAEAVNGTKVPDFIMDKVMPRQNTVRFNNNNKHIDSAAIKPGSGDKELMIKGIDKSCKTTDVLTSNIFDDRKGHQLKVNETTGIYNGGDIESSTDIRKTLALDGNKGIELEGNVKPDVCFKDGEKGGTMEEKNVLLISDRENRVLMNGDVDVGKDDKEFEEKGRLVDMFKSKVLAARTVIIFLNWAVISMVFYSLNFNMRNLETGSIFLNFFIGGLVEFPGHATVLFTVDRFGRKIVHCAMMGISGIACLLCVLAIIFVPDEHQWLTVVLAMVGKYGVAGSFGTIYMYSTELYPTVIRNSALGASSSWARAGAMLAPYVAAQGAKASGPFGRGLPLLLCGILILCVGGLSSLLPETLHRKLPETIADAKYFNRKRPQNDDSRDQVSEKAFMRITDV